MKKSNENAYDEKIHEDIGKLLDEISEFSNPSFILGVNRKIFNKSRSLNDEVAKRYYKQIYLEALLEYGYNEKLSWQDEGRTALNMFQTALNFDPGIPIANYRIGHILFKRKEYTKAIYYFERGLERRHENDKFDLDNIQELTTKKMLSFAAIKTFEQYSIDIDGYEQYTELDFLIYNYIENNSEIFNEEQLKYSDDGGKTYSLKTDSEYDELQDEIDDLILDKYAGETKICYCRRQMKMPMHKVGLLIELLEDREDIINPYYLEDHFQKSYEAQKKEISRISNVICAELGIDKKTLGLYMEDKKAVFKPKVKTIILKRLQD